MSNDRSAAELLNVLNTLLLSFVTLHEKKYHLAQNYIIQYGVEKSTYEYFVENQFIAQSNYSIYKLPFDTRLVALLLVVPEIEATRLLGHFSPWSS